ncbi:MAG TPA: ABC transporter permease [Oligoflexus sp.]|uniref:ABC transporter permease n=1 Tax=Oligoflexus sp. TaxID=1971216 RepID=UPI002D2F9082|nr:ABC transporter permease [Oligoflexus sp.]HYX39881.1 ABC transporter permease [Oligoflexus sp.]
MNKIWLIARRELNAYFSTWMGYIIIFAALLIDGMLFNAFAIGDDAKLSSDVLKDFFFFSSGIGMVAAVFLAMRLLAEEKQTGTIVLFYTSPLSERQLVYGKFLSALIMFVILQLLSVYLPCLIFLEGKVSVGHMVAGYLGVTLLGAGVLALSLFASVVSPNQLIAGITAAAMTVFFLLLWLLSYRVDEPFRQVFAYMSIHNERFRPFTNGVLHTRDVVYYGSLIFFFLECSIKSLETRRLQG